MSEKMASTSDARPEDALAERGHGASIWESLRWMKDIKRALGWRRGRMVQRGIWHEPVTRASYWLLILQLHLVVLVFITVMIALGLYFSWGRFGAVITGMSLCLPILIFVGEQMRMVDQGFRARLRNRHGRPFFCHRCAYDLRCSGTPTCPECGCTIEVEMKRPRERWRVVRGRKIMRAFRWLGVGAQCLFVVLWVWVLFLR